MFNSTRREAAPATTPDPRVVRLLEAAAAPGDPGAQPGENEALAAFVASRAASEGSRVSSSARKAKVTVVAVLSGALLTGGVGAAAASGSLPGSAQDTASEWLSKVGVRVPGAARRTAGPADGKGGAQEAVADDVPEGDGRGDGETLSGVARDDDLAGRDKGEAVSEIASAGRSRAGEHGREWGRGHDAASEDESRPGRAEADEREERATRFASRDRVGEGGRTTKDADRKDTEEADGGRATGTDVVDHDKDDGGGDHPRDADSGERP